LNNFLPEKKTPTELSKKKIIFSRMGDEITGLEGR
jgi:hypothetical protein